ncbi:conserved hypothetical protein [Tenacibaculum finnmarkense genomovar ulcerans]|uniref:Type I restriction modification DNA specificity domain-containing protein n=1 Tax=Tenacibaculum finnmarkense genomovar ulcerans TaxID=2781388 RepID=A0A2I2MA08_9FLAO|nr:restriction endonuclease subunit S [Tenacibaculum finnmarkense]SOU88754.1 conserved hypothetical protein [Tenacibaculum finnmarkense genomovar ulcerans]
MKVGYKKSALGEIPVDWEVVKLGKVCKLKGGFAFKSSDSCENGIRWVKIANVGVNKIKWDDKSYLPFDFQIRNNDFVLHEGDIILAMTRPILSGKLKIARISKFDSGSLLNQRVGRIVEDENLNKNFAYQVFNSSSFINLMEKELTGTDPPNISSSIFESLNIPLPPLQEQQKIAEILSTVDAKISIIDEQISENKNLKKGLMQSLLSKGIGHTEFKKSALGEIPKSWEVVRLAEIGEFFKGKGISKSEILKEGKYSCIRYGEIYTIYDTIIYQLKSFINQDSADKSNSFNSGDLLFTGSGETAEDIGKCVTYIGNEKVFASGDLIIHRPNKGNSKFLSYTMNSSIVRNQTKKLGQGNSVVHIYTKHLSEITFALPPLKEQEKIASILNSVDEKLGVLSEKKSYYQNLKKGLMQQLLTGKVRVSV